MPTFLLCHRHEPSECPVAFAAWRGFASPLRHRATLGSCVRGRHELWWTVDAADAVAALEMLPLYVADRTDAIEVAEIPIP